MSSPEVRAWVKKRIDDTNPKLVILSPPCTKFSRRQQLNIHVHGPVWEAEFNAERQKAAEHVEYSMELAKLLMSKGNYSLFAHPAYATSWELPSVSEVRSMAGVDDIVSDQCMFGLVTPNHDHTGFAPAKKPTRFLSNAPCILEELNRRCDGSHRHQPLMGGRARLAQEYTYELCRSMCAGLRKQKEYDRTGRIRSGEMQACQLNLLIKKARLELSKIENRVSRQREESDTGSAPVTDEAARAHGSKEEQQGPGPSRNSKSEEEDDLDIHDLPTHWSDRKH